MLSGGGGTIGGVTAESSTRVHAGVRQVRPWSAWRAVAAASVCAIALTGCSGAAGGGNDGDEAAPSNSGVTSTDPTGASTTASPEQTDERATPPGTKLTEGKPAVVRFTANPKHDSLVKLTVTKVKQGTIKDLAAQFELDDQARRSSVYYVSASVKNVGKGELGGQPITLYGQVSEKLVVPPVILKSTFKRCDYQPLPEKFGPGKRANVCIVLLAPRHGKVTSVQWRPADNSEPISWAVR